MALTVSEMRELPVAESFKLVAGNTGLDRLIEHVNLLDFEYDTWEPEAKQSDGLFDDRSIIVTSLIFAKNKPEKILPVVKQLYLDGISAVAVKEVYYNELPDEVIKYADEKSIPIFMFDSERNFSDNIVVSLTMAIEEHDNVDGLAEKVAFLLQDNLGSINRAKLIEELFPELRHPFRCYYFMYKDIHSTFSYHHKILSLRSRKGEEYIVLPYQYGILVTVFGDALCKLADIQAELDMSASQYYCGISRTCKRKEDIVYKIRECLYACNYARGKGRDMCKFEEMGIWQVIIPNQDNYWMKSYCGNIVNRLKSYDTDGNVELYDTVSCYVKNGCDVNRTAEQMVVHKNTIRYRIGKAKEILGLESDNSGFDESIFFAVLFTEAM